MAVVQFTPQFHELEANWARITETAEREPADLVVFPELSSCGYRYTRRAEILPYTDTRSALRPLQEIARRSGQLFVGGFAERVGRQLYNSAYVISAQGLRVYRKLHLWNFERVLFRPGNRLLSFPFGGHRLGVEICYDLQFPEVAVALARAGAEMLIVPMAW
ncbi:MAG TPA: carbon-nitrogen hydrolase family protein, partial [Thermoplasmata archaeon]|nr:carbon-nitrogen hydrolase family protein [Thermoplasmata archaeon]